MTTPLQALRAYAVLGALIGWFGLGLQYALLVQGFEAGAVSATIRFFSFFTTLTNVLVALSYTAVLLPNRSAIARFFTRARVQSGIALAIALVGIAYSLLLRRIWDPQGWQLVADRLLHDVAPVAYVVFWLIWVPKGDLRFADVARWTVYPVAYFAYALAQAPATGWYPYPFLDVAALGYASVLRNAAVILALFVVAGLAMITAGRRFGRPSAASPNAPAAR